MSPQSARSTQLLKGVGILLAIAGSLLWYRAHGRQQVADRIFGTRQVFDAFGRSETVSAQRLRHPRAGRAEGSNTFLGYQADPPVKVAQVEAQRLIRILQKRSTYHWMAELEKACIVDYAVLITFTSAKGTTRIAFCFK